MELILIARIILLLSILLSLIVILHSFFVIIKVTKIHKKHEKSIYDIIKKYDDNKKILESIKNLMNY